MVSEHRAQGKLLLNSVVNTSCIEGGGDKALLPRVPPLDLQILNVHILPS